MDSYGGIVLILVEIYVPAVDEKYDFELDENVKIGKIIDELNEMLNKKMKSPVSESSEGFFLCTTERKDILSKDRTLYQSNVRDGHRLLLI